MTDELQEPGTESDGVASKILKSERFEAVSEAKRFVERAHGEGQEIVAAAHRDAEAVRAAAEQQGREEAAALVAEYARRMREEIAAIEPKLTETVLECLRRLIDPQPAHETVAAAVVTTMKEIEIGRGAALIVAPQLVKVLREQLGARGVGTDVIEVRGDPDCPPESSLLRCDFGDIELGIELQLRAIERGLRAAASNGGGT